MSSKVLIADDDHFICDEIERLLCLSNEFILCAKANDGVEAVQLASDHHPNIVILDIDMPDMDGFNAAVEIKKEIPHSKILFLSLYNDKWFIKKAIAVGARGFLPKEKMVKQLTPALRILQRGGVFFPSDLFNDSSSNATP